MLLLFKRKIRFCILCCGLFPHVNLLPAETPALWYESIFIEGAVQYYFIPGLLADLAKADPGFRGALGYEWWNFRFSAESGYTHIIGTNPLVSDIEYIPLLFKVGYAYPVKWGLGVQADLGLGLVFSKVERYETAIDLVIEKNKRHDDSRSLLAGARLYGTYTFPGNFLKLYVGGGADIIIEPEGPLPLPVLEAGISLKPFKLARIIPKKPAVKPPEIEKSLDVREPLETIPQKKIPAEPEFIAVYFEPNNAVLIERFRPELDRAGELLRDNPGLTVILSAYTAPFHTREGQEMVAAGRAAFCREYLVINYGINEECIKIELHGAQSLPRQAEEMSWESYRCVELIIQHKGE